MMSPEAAGIADHAYYIEFKLDDDDNFTHHLSERPGVRRTSQ
jgi:hypothetical protein